MKTNTMTQEERQAWLKSKNLFGYELITSEEALALQIVCQNSATLRAQLAAVLQDTKRLDVFEILFFTRKLYAVSTGEKLTWGYKVENKDFGPFENIRAMIDDAIKNLEAESAKEETQDAQ